MQMNRRNPRPCEDQVSPVELERTVPWREACCRTAANSNTEHYLQQESRGHLAQLLPKRQKYLILCLLIKVKQNKTLAV